MRNEVIFRGSFWEVFGNLEDLEVGFFEIGDRSIVAVACCQVDDDFSCGDAESVGRVG